MKRISLNFSIAFAAFVMWSTALAADLSPSVVLSNANQYDGKQITVSGVVSDFGNKVSHSGNTYETFKLCDESACLDVFAWGNAPRPEGSRISGTGHFYKVKRVGRYVFYNELDLD